MISRNLQNLNGSFILAGVPIQDYPSVDNEILLYDKDTNQWILTIFNPSGVLTGVANVGIGAGEIFKNITTGVARLRTINTTSNITCGTATDTVDLDIFYNQSDIRQITSATGELKIINNLNTERIRNETSLINILGGFYINDFSPAVSTNYFQIFNSSDTYFDFKAVDGGTNTSKQIRFRTERNGLPYTNLILNNDGQIYLPEIGAHVEVSLPAKILCWDSGTLEMKIFDSSLIGYNFANVGGGEEILQTPIVGNNINFKTLTTSTNIIYNSTTTEIQIDTSSTLRADYFAPRTITDLNLINFDDIICSPNDVATAGIILNRRTAPTQRPISLFFNEDGGGTNQYNFTLNTSNILELNHSPISDGQLNFNSPTGIFKFDGSANLFLENRQVFRNVMQIETAGNFNQDTFISKALNDVFLDTLNTGAGETSYNFRNKFGNTVLKVASNSNNINLFSIENDNTYSNNRILTCDNSGNVKYQVNNVAPVFEQTDTISGTHTINTGCDYCVVTPNVANNNSFLFEIIITCTSAQKEKVYYKFPLTIDSSLTGIVQKIGCIERSKLSTNVCEHIIQILFNGLTDFTIQIYNDGPGTSSQTYDVIFRDLSAFANSYSFSTSLGSMTVGTSFYDSNSTICRIDSCQDVIFSGLSAGQQMQWNGSYWQNITPSGSSPSYAYAQLHSSSATTTIAIASTYYAIQLSAPVSISPSTGDWNNTALTNSQIKYTGSTRYFDVSLIISMSSIFSGNLYSIQIFKNGIPATPSTIMNNHANFASRQYSFTTHGIIQMNTNDILEMTIANLSFANDAVVSNIEIKAIGL